MMTLVLLLLLQTLPPATGNPDRDTVIAHIVDQAQQSLHRLYPAETHRFDITPRWLPNQLLQTPVERIIAVEAPGEQVRGIANFRVHIAAGQRITQTDIQLFVRVEQFLPVLRERKHSGQTLTAGDLHPAWTDITMERTELFVNADAVSGTVLRRNMAQGDPIRVLDVRSGTIIEAGTLVTIHFNAEGLVVELMGVARQTGETGETIRVFSEVTRRTYLAEVTGPAEVLWKQTL